MPAATASLLSLYSSWEMEGSSLPTKWGGPGWGLRLLDRRSVGGKLEHRLRDLGRAWHEELLLRCVERHRGDVRRRDPHHRPVEAVESVLRDDRRDLRAEPAREVVLMHDHRLARLDD